MTVVIGLFLWIVFITEIINISYKTVIKNYVYLYCK